MKASRLRNFKLHVGLLKHFPKSFIVLATFLIVITILIVTSINRRRISIPNHLHRVIRSLHGSTASWIEINDAPGYLIGNRSDNLMFSHYEPSSVDFRVIVLAFDRAESLRTCLESLNRVDYKQDVIALHVWIDRTDNVTSNTKDYADESRGIDSETAKVANEFNFTAGSYTVHYQTFHAGVQGQWMNVWRPAVSGFSREIALILEDDMTVSPFMWAWLKAAHHKYDVRDDVSGYSVSSPDMEHKHGGPLEVPIKHPLFLYRVICTWGFSPHSVNWRHFQDWFYTVAETNGTFLPIVDSILPTEWFLSERKHGRERTLWEQWHICYTHLKNQYTVLSNPPTRVGLLAVNRHERGLHDGRSGVVGATSALCEEPCSHSTWKSFPDDPIHVGYDGKEEI